MSSAAGPKIEPTTYIIGAGLAGLSTALRLTRQGRKVALLEGAGHAGGRCRSFHDDQLGCLIDNGNHLLFSGNSSAWRYLEDVKALSHFHIADTASFPFVDLEHGTSFRVEMNAGPLPLWMLNANRRVPGASFIEHLAVAKLLFAGSHMRVADTLKSRGALWRGFVEPLTLAAINTVPEQASAQLLAAVLRETFLKGGTYCRPMIAKEGLGPALIEPALTVLRAHDVDVQFGCLLKQIEWHDERAARLLFANGQSTELRSGDNLVLAVPTAQLAKLLPNLSVPKGHSAILNAHFRVDLALTEKQPKLLGVLGAMTHWIFVRDGLLSLTVSGADQLGLLERSQDNLLRQLWSETKRALRLDPDLPYLAGRLIAEKRATFHQSPDNLAKRPDCRTSSPNLFLAGDATNTGLPATIEGALRSGEVAARHILANGR